MITNEIFIEKANKIHGDRYNYSLIDYKNNRTKVKIICKKHGIFEQNLKSHITKKYGCPICGGTGKHTKETFIKKSKEVHGNKYDYSLVVYNNNSTKVKIVCKKHGIFEQAPYHHMQNQQCPICSKVKKHTKETFIKKSKEVHGNKYDYSLVVYNNNRTKVKIICKKHGIFEQTPDSHLSGSNCHKCKNHYKPNEQNLYILYDLKYDICKIGISIDEKRRCRDINSRYYGGGNTIKMKKSYHKLGLLEKKILSLYKNNRIKHPTYNKSKSDGRTEWLDIDYNILINYIENKK